MENNYERDMGTPSANAFHKSEVLPLAIAPHVTSNSTLIALKQRSSSNPYLFYFPVNP